MAVILVTFSVPAMAVESVSDGGDNEVVTASEAALIEYFYTGENLTTCKYLGQTYFETNVNYIRWSVGRPNSSGSVIFKMVNHSTGDIRTFTTTANGITSGIDFVTPMTSGYWEISVQFATSGTNEGAHLYFYK